MHGEAMGNEEIAAIRLNLGWTSPPFEIPADIRAAWDMRDKGARAEQEWRTRFAAYKAEFPALAAELDRRMAGELPAGFADLVSAYIGRTQADKWLVYMRRALDHPTIPADARARLDEFFADVASFLQNVGENGERLY